MIQSQIVGTGGNNRPVPWIMHGTLNVKQRLLTIRFSPAIRSYKPTSGVVKALKMPFIKLDSGRR